MLGQTENSNLVDHRSVCPQTTWLLLQNKAHDVCSQSSSQITNERVVCNRKLVNFLHLSWFGTWFGAFHALFCYLKSRSWDAKPPPVPHWYEMLHIVQPLRRLRCAFCGATTSRRKYLCRSACMQNKHSLLFLLEHICNLVSIKLIGVFNLN